MTPVGFLLDERRSIVAAAAATITRSRNLHDTTAGAAVVLDRLEDLYDVVLAAVGSRDLGGTTTYARQLASERFAAGYDLCDVQSACNALEDATWTRLFAHLPPDELAEALILISTVFGATRDALAREYVTLAMKNHAPALDIAALFAGSA